MGCRTSAVFSYHEFFKITLLKRSAILYNKNIWVADTNDKLVTVHGVTNYLLTNFHVIDSESRQNMNTFDFWWRMIRPHTLSASLAPVFVGTAASMCSTGHLKPLLFFAIFSAAVIIQIAANLFNEYFDFIHGLDTADSVGISGTIVRDGASPKFVLFMALLCYVIAMILGLWLSYRTSWLLLVVGGICMVFGFLYAGGPYPISRTPFGELFAGGLMGSGLVLISFFIQTGMVTRNAVLTSIPSFILVALILTANNLRDRVGDEANGRRTLVILLGAKRSFVFMMTGIALAYIWLLVLSYLYSWILLLPLLSIGKVRAIVSHFSAEHASPKEMMPGMVAMSNLNRQYGYFLALALIISPYLN